MPMAGEAVGAGLVPGFTPETELERAVAEDPELRVGLAWGKPRSGHPEGSVGAHVADLLEEIENAGRDRRAPERSALPGARARLAEVSRAQLAARRPGRTTTPCARAVLARALHRRRAAAGDHRAARPPLRPVAKVQPDRARRRQRLRRHARADPRHRPVRELRRPGRVTGGQEPGTARVAQGRAYADARPASAPTLAAATRLRRPPGRGSRGRHLAGRFARDDVADRSTCDVRDAAASHLRHAFRSQGKGTRGAQDAVGAQAVLAEG